MWNIDHPLRQWRAKHGLAGRVVAPALGISVGSLSLIEGRRQIPTLVTALRISVLTCGDVKLEELLADPRGARPIASMDELLAARDRARPSIIAARSRAASKARASRRKFLEAIGKPAEETTNGKEGQEGG